MANKLTFLEKRISNIEELLRTLVPKLCGMGDYNILSQLFPFEEENNKKFYVINNITGNNIQFYEKDPYKHFSHWTGSGSANFYEMNHSKVQEEYTQQYNCKRLIQILEEVKEEKNKIKNYKHKKYLSSFRWVALFNSVKFREIEKEKEKQKIISEIRANEIQKLREDIRKEIAAEFHNKSTINLIDDPPFINELVNNINCNDNNNDTEERSDNQSRPSSSDVDIDAQIAASLVAEDDSQIAAAIATADLDAQIAASLVAEDDTCSDSDIESVPVLASKSENNYEASKVAAECCLKNKYTPKKKKTTGYILFSNTMRDDTKAQLAEKNPGEKVKNTEVITEMAKMWKALSEDEQKGWSEQAAAQQC